VAAHWLRTVEFGGLSSAPGSFRPLCGLAMPALL